MQVSLWPWGHLISRHEIAIPDRHWQILALMRVTEFASTLVDLAGRMNTRQYTQHKRGPKRPQPKKLSGKKIKHVSTAKLLAGIA